jgi:6-phosphogluconolactonase/glucosamine-6-phosphate isomerase/deaminase
MDGGSTEIYPVKFLKPTNGTVIWLVDRAAAKLLKDIKNK